MQSLMPTILLLALAPALAGALDAYGLQIAAWGAAGLDCGAIASQLSSLGYACALPGGAVGAIGPSCYALLDARCQIDAERVDAATHEYGWAGWRVDTYALAGLSTPDGEAARFRVVRPALPSGDYGLLLDLHGGCSDVDSEAEPEGESGRCTADYAAGEVASSAENGGWTQVAVDAGWVVVLPENASCDGWAGLGEDDPVDTLHAGYALAAAAADFVREGQSAVAIDDGRLFASGSSLGAMGAVWFALNYDGLDGLVFDSGPADAVRWYTDGDYTGSALATVRRRYDHILGGSPYEDEEETVESAWFPRYEDSSLLRSVERGALSLPILHVHNSQDTISPPIQHEDVPAALEAAGLRAFTFDADHASPGHGQLQRMITPYTPHLARRFLEGRSVEVLEGEDDAASPVGAPATPVDRFAFASGDAVRAAAATDGAGRLFRAYTDAAGEVSATFFLSATGAADARARGAVLRLLDGGAVVASRRVSQAERAHDTDDYPAVRARLRASTLSAIASGPVTVEVLALGAADVELDLVVVDRAE